MLEREHVDKCLICNGEHTLISAFASSRIYIDKISSLKGVLHQYHLAKFQRNMAFTLKN